MMHICRNIESICLDVGYEIGKVIEENQNPVSSRINALVIPIICLISEIVKTVFDLKRIIEVSHRSLMSCRLAMGNIQTGVMLFAEHLRNISGVIVGLFLAVISPQTATKAFLTIDASDLQTKLDRQTAAKLYAMCSHLKTFFTHYQIDYRICSGTQLGAVRHEGIIPWDDDVDLMLHPQAMSKFRTLVENGIFTQETGLEIRWQPFTGGWQCFYADSPKGRGLLSEVGFPFVDIMGTVFDAQSERVVCGSTTMQYLFSEDYFTKEEWDNSKEYTFGPLKMLGIENAVPYLTRCYGEDSLVYAYQTMHHDQLAEIEENPLSVGEIAKKVWRYGLPRRAFISNGAPIEYNQDLYNELMEKEISSSILKNTF